jgi:multisubunit Na+/H+ antiporter MnhB subunit
MTVGFGIFLIVVGAIILYALNVEIAGVEESTLGWILIVAGIAVAVLGLIAAPFRLWAERRRTDYATRDDYVRGRNVHYR